MPVSETGRKWPSGRGAVTRVMARMRGAGDHNLMVRRKVPSGHGRRKGGRNQKETSISKSENATTGFYGGFTAAGADEGDEQKRERDFS